VTGPAVYVESAAGRTDLAEGERLTFGRARECTICLDPDDLAISRIAGALDRERGTVWIANTSATRPLSVVDELGFRSVLAPGRRAAVERHAQVIVDGTRGQHTLRISVEASHRGTAPEQPPGAPTATGEQVMISSADRLAMVALFAGYLEEPPRYDPYPKSYAAAAARLGWKRTTLVKRIEYLRARLDAAGVPNMTGHTALTNLAEYAISRSLVTRDDLALLRGGAGPAPVGEGFPYRSDPRRP
jgi:hypothetical protein